MKIVCSDTKEICLSYREYLKSKHWLNFKNLYFYKVSNCCMLCKKQYSLNLHHFDYECLGNEKFSDVVMLCASCHTNLHYMYGKITRGCFKNKYSRKSRKKLKSKKV